MTEELKRQLLAELTERVNDRAFDYLMDIIQEEVDWVFNSESPDWVKALDDDTALELQYELCNRIAISYS